MLSPLYRAMENIHLIIGLGNPGPEYSATRHNAGFLLLEKIAGLWIANWRDERRFKTKVAMLDRHGGRVLLCQPQTFMNASGEAVAAVSHFYKVPVEQMLVVVDDADLPLGTIRLRSGGSTGGHHGLESIQQHLGGAGFARQKIGIAPDRRTDGTRQISGFVLGRFSSTELPVLERVLEQAAGQIDCWLKSGLAKAMNDFNGTVKVPETERNKL